MKKENTLTVYFVYVHVWGSEVKGLYHLPLFWGNWVPTFLSVSPNTELTELARLTGQQAPESLLFHSLKCRIVGL